MKCSDTLYLKIMFADINECLVNNAGCENICVDTPGSFYCSCKPGLELSDDGKTCIGVYLI